MNMQNRVNRASQDLAEYYSSRQGMMHLGASALTVGGLLLGKTRIAAIGAAIFGLIIFPISMASGWRSRQYLTTELKRSQTKAAKAQKNLALPGATNQVKHLKSRVDTIHGEVRTTRKTMRGIYAINRQVERRLKRLENANRAHRTGA